MEELILIKLGGSVITDKKKAYTSKDSVIRRLGKEIAEARKKYKGKIIIGHGSGSYGHTTASKYKTHLGRVNRKSLRGASETAQKAAELNRIVVSNLLKSGLYVLSFAPSSFIVSAQDKGKISYFTEPIENSLASSFVPVVYGDVVMDINMGFTIFSTEKVFSVLIKKLYKKYKIKKIIQCSNTNGVLEENGRTIKKIDSKSFLTIKKKIIGPDTVDVTGGMLHKVNESIKIANKFRVETLIISGLLRGELAKAILGKKNSGTKITFI